MEGIETVRLVDLTPELCAQPDAGEAKAAIAQVTDVAQVSDEIEGVVTDSVTGMRFLWVPGGEFDMGSEQGRDNERPVHRVRLSPFLRGRPWQHLRVLEP